MAKTLAITAKENAVEIIVDGNKVNGVIQYELKEDEKGSRLKLEIDIDGTIEVRL